MNSQQNDQFIAFTRALVRQQSISQHEGAVIELVQAEMNRLGYDEVMVDANGSAIGIVRGDRPGPTVLLDAHCDTVGITAKQDWQHDPFGAEIADGMMYGRGTADMKGALAAMIYAAAHARCKELAGNIVVSATVMEEVMEGVSLGTVMEKVRPDYVIIGEATELNLNRGGRGRAEIHVETLGRPAHSSSPQLGVNAVLLMVDVIRAAERIAFSDDPLLGNAQLTLTDIISDPYPGYSVIPSRCCVTYDRRLLPGETEEAVIHQVASLPELANVAMQVQIAQGEHQTYTGAWLRAPKFFPAWILPETHPLVTAALESLHNVGIPARLGAYRFCTNAAYSAGYAGIPTIGFGPAAEGDAHVVDERIALADLIRASEGYVAMIQALVAVH